MYVKEDLGAVKEVRSKNYCFVCEGNTEKQFITEVFKLVLKHFEINPKVILKQLRNGKGNQWYFKPKQLFENACECKAEFDGCERVYLMYDVDVFYKQLDAIRNKRCRYINLEPNEKNEYGEGNREILEGKFKEKGFLICPSNLNYEDFYALVFFNNDDYKEWFQRRFGVRTEENEEHVVPPSYVRREDRALRVGDLTNHEVDGDSLKNEFNEYCNPKKQRQILELIYSGNVAPLINCLDTATGRLASNIYSSWPSDGFGIIDLYNELKSKEFQK